MYCLLNYTFKQWKNPKKKNIPNLFYVLFFVNCNFSIVKISNIMIVSAFFFLLFLQVEKWNEALVLIVAFFIYIIIGSIVIASYEPEMDFFGAIYFNFVSLTTIGLGDLVPKK